VKFLFVIICSSFLVNFSFSQEKNEDKYISQVNNYQADIKQKLSDYEPEVFTYSYCNRYVNQNGDTLRRKCTGGREIAFYLVKDKIVKVVDKQFGHDSLEFKIATEYLLKNDSLVLVTKSFRKEISLRNVLIEEDRIYFYNIRPYYHLAKYFKGLKIHELSFYDTPLVSAPSDTDISYKSDLEELLFNYSNKKMAVYKEVVK